MAHTKAEGKPLDVKLQVQYYTDIYAVRYPEHPYTRQIAYMLQYIRLADKGGRFIDFTAPHLQGKPVKLSDTLRRKNSLDRFWASRRGPCRKTAESMKPIYEACKDKGFTIVGLAREKENTAALEKAIAQRQLPWFNLVQLNDKEYI